MRGRTNLLLGISLGIALIAPSAADFVGARVVGVQDGDTISVVSEGRQERIRLADIDAPEKRQPWGQRSKQSLAELVMGKSVELEVSGTDKYGRKIARVKQGGMDVNLEQVNRGMAWAYRKYTKDPAILRAESTARVRESGLWADPHPLPPWEFRHEAADNPQAIVGKSPRLPQASAGLEIGSTRSGGGKATAGNSSSRTEQGRTSSEPKDLSEYFPDTTDYEAIKAEEHSPRYASSNPAKMREASGEVGGTGLVSAPRVPGLDTYGSRSLGPAGPTYVGPRGGVFHYSASGHKVYDKKGR